MKKKTTFHFLLVRSLLLASFLPVLLCFVLLLPFFELGQRQELEREATQSLQGFERVLTEYIRSFSEASRILDSDPVLTEAFSGEILSTVFYNHLFNAATAARATAPYRLYDAEGVCLYSTEENAVFSSQSPDWGILAEAARSDRTVVCSADLPGDGLSFAHAFRDSEGQVMGTLVMSLDSDVLMTAFSPYVSAPVSYVLLDAYWHPLADGGSDSELVAFLRDQGIRTGSLPRQDENNRYSLLYHEATGLTILLIQPLSAVQGTLLLLQIIVGLSAVLGLVIAVLLSMSLSRRLFLPVSALSRAFRSVEQNDLSVRMEGDDAEEFDRLNDQFNQMITALKLNQEQLVEKERTLNDTQLKMLQAQLNPHFLCNTLDTMKWLGKINHVPEVAVISTDLADLLRSSISADAFIPLKKEAELLERYVEIQRIRLSDRFTFTLSLPEELKDCLVPKLILQPLTENAILHGIDDVESGRIEVSVRADETRLYLTVTDNGPGFPEEMLGAYHGTEEPRERGHLGLSNIDAFLKKNYGTSYGLVLSNTGAGARITATLPVTVKGGQA